MTDLSRRALAALPLAGLAVAAAADADAAIPGSYDWAVRRHLDAVQARDLDALARTLTNRDELILILPNGVMTRTKAEYIAFHREWFAASTWRIEFEELWAQTTLGIGQSLFRTRYVDQHTDGSPYESSAYLTLTFRREGTDWKLWHDQNTRIAAG
ncbi:MAG: DUF4440 domain-containing protein [Alphaproteobacteria bacterium]|nr:DUF4440 domain-containing protein [Alphaproteobacteria bacterium]